MTRLMLAAGIPGGAIPCELISSVARWFGDLIVQRACSALGDLPSAQYDAEVLAGVIAASDWFASRKGRILSHRRQVE